MKNNAFRAFVVLIELTLPLGLTTASGTQRKANSRPPTSSFSMMLLPMQAQSDEYKELAFIAAQALETVSPATKQWFAATAEQHPPGPFDIVWATKALQKKFSVSSGAGGSNPVDGLWAVMMAYQKILNRDAREDKKIARRDAREALKAKEAKMDATIQSIEQQQREARERFDRAMAAADSEMWIGLMSTLCSTLDTGFDSLLNSKQPPEKVNCKNKEQAVIRKLRAQLATLRTSGL